MLGLSAIGEDALVAVLDDAWTPHVRQPTTWVGEAEKPNPWTAKEAGTP